MAASERASTAAQTTQRQRPSCLILVRRLGRLNFRRTCLIRCRTSSRSLWGAATPRVALPRYPTNGSAYKYNTGDHLFPRESRMITSSGHRTVGPWQRSLVHARWRARRFEQLRLYSEAEFAFQFGRVLVPRERKAIAEALELIGGEKTKTRQRPTSSSMHSDGQRSPSTYADAAIRSRGRPGTARSGIRAAIPRRTGSTTRESS